MMEHRANHAGETGRVLKATPHEIAVQVAHQDIDYGEWIARLEGGHVLKLLKQAVFVAIKDAIVEHSKRGPRT